MSALLAVAVQAVVTATSTPTPTPAVVQAAAPHVNSFLGTLNGLVPQVSQEHLVELGVGLAVGVQSLLNKLSFFQHALDYVQKFRRHLLSVVLPATMTIGASLATGHNQLGWMPVLFVGAQILFHACSYLLGKFVAAMTKDDSPVVDPAVQL